MEPKSIVITGATGFIGSNIASFFTNQKLRVSALVRKESDLTKLPSTENLRTFCYQKLNEKKLIDFLIKQKSDIFIHCAWKGVDGESRNKDNQINFNIPFTLSSVELASKVGCIHWIGFGSQAEYGNHYQAIDEKTPLKPYTAYGKSKLAAGVAALKLCEQKEIMGSWLRLFSVFGPYDRSNSFISYLITELLDGRSPNITKCEQIWEYLYVDNLAEAILCMTKKDVCGVFNIGSGDAKVLKDFLKIVRGMIKNSPQPNFGVRQYRNDQVMHLCADISKITKMTGWKPTVSFQEGILSTINFLKTTQVSSH